MKKNNIYNKVGLGVISFLLPLSSFLVTSCESKLDVSNPNQQTTATFGNTAEDLEENVIAAYNHIRMEGTYARVGYTLDVCRGDEVWNSSQVWYMPFDDLNAPFTDEIGQWSWRDWYYTINVCNYTLSRCGEDNSALNDQMKHIKGQMLFLRGLAYYNLAGYYQNPLLITDYATYSSLDGLYGANRSEGDSDANDQYDRVWDQVEKDLSEAMTLLPSRDMGAEWCKGRATCGAAAGFYARALMMRHKYSEALTVLKDIIGGRYGSYQLMANYGDNFREGSAYCGGWADLSASPWLYQLFKAERTTTGSLDPRLYWTIGTYEPEWEQFEYGNICYLQPMSDEEPVVTNNNYGGLPIAKNTNLRTGLYDKVVTGLHCGINLRMMRYSDVLLRAAECENEISGPTQQAIDWINQVRNRAGLANLNLSDFSGNADKLFEQIANVERPKEFGCEWGRGYDLLRWGFFYDNGRLLQIKEHGTFRRTNDRSRVKEPVSYSEVGDDPELKSSYDSWIQGHEFFPIYQGTLNDNPNLVGNSANYSSSNASYFSSKGWSIHPVVNL